MKSPPVIGLVVHPRNDVRASATAVVELAARYHVRVIARPDDVVRVGAGVDAVSTDEFAKEADFVFSLGGDGTMLGAMRLFAGRPTPVLGVNHGNLGFLIEITPAELPRALERLMANDFSLEPHSCLAVTAGASSGIAFNDAVFTAADPWTSVTMDLEVNGVRHGYYRGDALVACTSTGSTAYNYAAGGPVLSPSAPVIGLTPVAPMSGISRPVVLGGDDTISLRAPSGAVRVSLDGAVIFVAGPGTEVSVRLRPHAVNVVRFDSSSHGTRTQVKLSLLDLPLRPDQLIELIPQHLRDRLQSSED